MTNCILWLLFGAGYVAATTLTPYHRPAKDDLLVPDQYIVGLNDNCTFDAHWENLGLNLSSTATILDQYDFVDAYHARIDEATLHDLVRADPAVKYVAHNTWLSPRNLSRQDHKENVTAQATNQDFYTGKPAAGSQPTRRWTTGWGPAYWFQSMVNAGDKIDLRADKKQDDFFHGGGLGVNVYLLDTGMRISHSIFHDPKFQGTAVNFRRLQNSPYILPGAGPADNLDSAFPHGTQCGGIVALHANGATVVNVKISNGWDGPPEWRGSLNDVIRGRYQTHPPDDLWKGSVISISLEFSNAPPVEEAIKNAYHAGIPVVYAAGNGHEDSPPGDLCSVNPYVICVGSIERDYSWSPRSDYGHKVVITAPGANIRTSDPKNDEEYQLASGTSVAGPVVAAVMSNFISLEGINNNVQLVQERLFANALNGKISGVPSSDTPNRLVLSGLGNKQKNPKLPYLGAPAYLVTPY